MRELSGQLPGLHAAGDEIPAQLPRALRPAAVFFLGVPADRKGKHIGIG